MGVFVLRVHDEFVAGSVKRNANAALSALVLVAAFAFNGNAAADQISVKLVESFRLLLRLNFQELQNDRYRGN